MRGGAPPPSTPPHHLLGAPLPPTGCPSPSPLRALLPPYSAPLGAPPPPLKALLPPPGLPVGVGGGEDPAWAWFLTSRPTGSVVTTPLPPRSSHRFLTPAPSPLTHRLLGLLRFLSLSSRFPPPPRYLGLATPLSSSCEEWIWGSGKGYGGAGTALLIPDQIVCLPHAGERSRLEGNPAARSGVNSWR